MAILLAVEQWRPYLQHREFLIQTDHASLAHLQDQRLHTTWQHKVLSKLMGLQYRIAYKKGSENRVADALSRRPHPDMEIHAISRCHPAWLMTIIDAYQQDQFTKELLQRLLIRPDEEEGYTLIDGVIRKQGRIWLPNSPELHARVIHELHATPIGGHSGIPVTLRRIK
jgi:hypothetical protein